MEDRLSLAITTSFQFSYDKETGNWRCIRYPSTYTYAAGEVTFEVHPDSELE